MRPVGTLLALMFVAMLVSACGVAFSAPPRDHTVFQSLKVTGDMRTGEPLTAALAYQQNLPIEIGVRCELRQAKKLLKIVGDMTIPAYAGGSPKATPFPGNVSFDFTVDSPGDFRVECYAVSDQDDSIIDVFTVHRAS